MVWGYRIKSTMTFFLKNVLYGVFSKFDYDSTLSPKAITGDELLGYIDKNKTWKYGVLSSLMKKMCKNEKPYKPLCINSHRSIFQKRYSEFWLIS